MAKTASMAPMTKADPATLRNVRAVFTIEHDMEIMRWLKARPDIASALLASRPMIEDVFGAETKVALELVHDLEAESDPGSLFTLIQTGLEPSRARPLMAKFRNRWWASAPASIGEGLTFGLAYR
jgi:hypothetical protein